MYDDSACGSVRSDSLPSIFSAIGRTPLLTLEFAAEGLTLFAKAEHLNPSGSIKDRLAQTIFQDLARRRLLRPDTTLLEVSSGNTGISLAMLGAALGCRVHILMSDTASVERQQLIRHHGAELTLFRADRGYLTGLALADRMAAADPRFVLPRQFENPLNARDHATHTAPEILAAIPGQRVDAFVSGYGTGGTLAGAAVALRRANPRLLLAAMEPDGGPLPPGELPCCELIEGIAGGFRPPLLREVAIDLTIKVGSAEALAMTRRLAREFGLFVGPSSGANVCAALQVARLLGPSRHVATILCDRAERYFSTSLFDLQSN